MALGLALLHVLVLLPFGAQVRIGAFFGRCLYHLAPSRRHIAETNIRLCFPELDARAQRELVRETFESSGISLLEIGLAWWGRDSQLAPLAHIEGLEHLQHALAEGKGVILLSAHFTCLEIGGRLLARHQPFAVVYRRQNNPLLEAVTKHSRETHFQRAIPRTDTRALVRALRDGLACWYAPDQDFGRKKSVFAPFLGVQAATLPSTSRLAKLSAAPVVPFFPQRLPSGAGYRLIIQAPLENFPCDDEVADATRINAIIEAQVRAAPEQYLWLHRRFRTRPEGEALVYPPKKRKR
jgi:KDO2-lipid IV(A) lauroyltransferase